jgi:hypothetical protein
MAKTKPAPKPEKGGKKPPFGKKDEKGGKKPPFGKK